MMLVSVSLSTVGRDIGIQEDQLQWLVSAFYPSSQEVLRCMHQYVMHLNAMSTPFMPQHSDISMSPSQSVFLEAAVL